MSTLFDARWAYLAHLLCWGLPLLAFQLCLLVHRHRRAALSVARTVLPPTLVVTAWLVAADHVAISAGIWHFAPQKHLGITLGAVPVEEVVFFALTNLLVAFGLALLDGLGVPAAERT